MKFDATELNLIEIAQQYSDEDKARELLESLRWPNGPVCPHCNAIRVYRLKPRATSKTPGRKGLLKCAECRKQFTVKVGTVFEDSHIPISKWLMAVFLVCSSKKAMSAHQLHRMLKITYKTAWFMAHRIRYAMTQGPLADLMKGIVEIDETYVGGKPLLRTFGDARNLAFTAPGTTFSADELNHSTPTTAGGRVLNDAIGGAGAIIAAGAGGSVIR